MEALYKDLSEMAHVKRSRILEIASIESREMPVNGHPSATIRAFYVYLLGIHVVDAVSAVGIPGPDNAEVLLVLQVKSGKEWRVFRRYRTHEGGHFLMRYRFTQTFTPTTYIMRAQLRKQSGYPYEEGNSRAIPVKVES